MTTPPTFYDMAVVGMHFRQEVNAKGIVANFVPPLTLDYEREPFNQFDSNAIKVFYEGDHIGYIDRESASYFAPRLDEGFDYTLTVVRMEQRGKNLHPIVTATPISE